MWEERAKKVVCKEKAAAGREASVAREVGQLAGN